MGLCGSLESGIPGAWLQVFGDTLFKQNKYLSVIEHINFPLFPPVTYCEK